MSIAQESQKPGLLDYTARALGSPQLGALVALAAALTLGAGLILWSIKPSMVPLFEQVDRQEVAQILDVLRTENVVYEIQPKTGLVMVAQDKADSIRMKLAAEGIPGTYSTGMEMLQQEQSLGTSQFMESNRYQHALETELSRTISSMRNIDSARVHLAIPKQSVFIRNRAKSSASVMVKLFPGRTLEKGQVLSIVNLVASSIPYLESSQVTVVDQWGKLFSSQDDGSGSNETSKQFEYTRQLESLYAKRIEALLAPLVGEGNVRATVTADIDFSTNEQTQELFEGDAAQIRSEQSQDQIMKNGGAALGIPGALSNQPPVAGTTDPNAVGPNQPKNADEPVNSMRNSTRNYELDKTITHQRKAPGTIRQVSAAVIIDDHKSVNEAGEVVRTPLTAEEIAKFTSLVREAVGFREIRGDSVVVLNQSFQPPQEIQPVEPLPVWEQPWFWGAGKQLLAGFGVLLLILMVVRPAMRNLKPGNQLVAANGKGGTLHVEVGDDPSDESSQSDRSKLEAPKQVYGDILNMARAMADEDPKRVAKVVKDWVGSADD
ncbi:MAG: flagellar M-ring protein FliF [Gammaproteobacteria bacterium]|nr:flagellar M-ring protein FliF [Gammaproteobacteria bacterium]